MKKITLILLLFSALFTQAQNMIQNPDFESGSVPASGFSVFSQFPVLLSNTWSNIDPVYACNPRGTPDLFDASSSDCPSSAPVNNFGNSMFAHLGNRYVGFGSSNSNAEVISGPLTSSVTSAGTYYVRIWTRRVNTGNNCSGSPVPKSMQTNYRIEVILFNSSTCASRTIMVTGNLASTNWECSGQLVNLTSADAANAYNRIAIRENNSSSSGTAYDYTLVDDCYFGPVDNSIDLETTVPAQVCQNEPINFGKSHSSVSGATLTGWNMNINEYDPSTGMMIPVFGGGVPLTTSNLRSFFPGFQPGKCYYLFSTFTFQMGGSIYCTPFTTTLTAVDTVCVDSCMACDLNIDFTASIFCNKVTVRAQSLGTTTPVLYYYTFGDGSTLTGASGEHTYAGPGTYRICLYVTGILESGEQCCKYICKDITITAPDTCLKSRIICWDTCEAVDIQYLNCCGIEYANELSEIQWIKPDGSTIVMTPSQTIQLCSPADTGISYLKFIKQNGCVCITQLTLTDSLCAEDTCGCDKLVPDFTFDITNGVIHTTNTTSSPGYFAQLDWKIYDSGGMIIFHTGSYSDPNYSMTRSLLPGTYTICLDIQYVICGIECAARICKEITIEEEGPLAPALKSGIKHSFNPGESEGRMLSLVPNPASAQFKIATKGNNTTYDKVVIYNSMGQVILEKQNVPADRIFNLGDKAKGSYKVKVVIKGKTEVLNLLLQ